MTQPLYLYSLLVCLLLLVWRSQLISYSDGPPAGRTAAPGELSCYNGYCHNTYPLNSGPAEVVLQSDIPEDGYVPGETYVIRPAISSLGMKRFGFQLQSVNAAADMGVGDFVGFDSTALQILTETNRVYITHTLAKAQDDSASWEFVWQAPEAGTGPIAFYAAFLAANFNGNRSGDYVYTHQLEIAENPQTSISEALEGQIRLYPTRFGDQLLFERKHKLALELRIVDMNGKLVYQQHLKTNDPTRVQIATHSWAKGVYIAQVFANGQKWSQKLIKN